MYAVMQTYGERLLFALERVGRSRRELSRALQISEQAIGQVINGRTVALTAENTAEAAKALQCDHYWLATGKGSPEPSGLSPLAVALAEHFDANVPPHLRAAVYATATSAIDIAGLSRPPEPAPPGAASSDRPPPPSTSESDPPPTRAPRRRR